MFFLKCIQCSDKYLNEENSDTEMFTKLGYPKCFLIELKRKARKILERNNSDKPENKYLIVPGSKMTQALRAALHQVDTPWQPLEGKI